MLRLTDRERAIVLAALRHIQYDLVDERGRKAEANLKDLYRDHFYGLRRRVTGAEVDKLCERLNTAEDRATESEIERARDMYQTDEIQIDPGALASRDDDGVERVLWVQGWLLVDHELREDKMAEAEKKQRKKGKHE